MTLMVGEEESLDLVKAAQICSDLLEAPHFLSRYKNCNYLIGFLMIWGIYKTYVDKIYNCY